MPEKTIMDNFLDAFAVSDIKTVKACLDNPELDVLDDNAKCFFLESALNAKNIKLAEVLLDKFNTVFLAKQTGEALTIQFIGRILNKAWISSQSERIQFVKLFVSRGVNLRIVLKAAVQEVIFDAEVFVSLCESFFPADDPTLYPIGMTEAISANNNNAVKTILNLFKGEANEKTKKFLLPLLRGFKEFFYSHPFPVQVAILCFSARYEKYVDFQECWNQRIGLSEIDVSKIVRSCTEIVKDDLKTKLLLILETDTQGNTFLHYLVWAMDQIPQDLLKRLFKKYQKEINQPNSLGKTVLHLLCERYVTYQQTSHSEFIHTILGLQANPNVFDINGCSPLHVAVQKRHLGLIQLLKDYGADPALQNGKFLSPINMVRAIKDDNIKYQILFALKEIPQEKIAISRGPIYLKKRKFRKPISNPRQAYETSLDDFIPAPKLQRVYLRNSFYKNKSYSIPGQLIQAIQDNHEATFGKMMSENVTLIDDSSRIEILTAIIDHQRNNMLLLMLEDNVKRCFANPETASAVLCRAIETMNIKIIEFLLKHGAGAYIELPNVKQLIAEKNDPELNELVSNYCNSTGAEIIHEDRDKSWRPH